MDFKKVEEALCQRGYRVTTFSTGAEAAEYLDRVIDGQKVSMGGSVSLSQLDIPRRLARHNTLCLPSAMYEDIPCQVDWVGAASAPVFVTSVNALAQTGEMVSIDGLGNRIASSVYGHQKVYFVIGRNKLVDSYDAAVWRARNVAAPRNAARLKMNTPCAVSGRCHDCNSPERICRAMMVLWGSVFRIEMEVLLIDEDLGF